MTDEQKIVFAQERWIKTLRHFQAVKYVSNGPGIGMTMKDPDKDERPYIFDAIRKQDLSLWKICTYNEDLTNQPELSMRFLLTKEDDHEQKNLNIIELDEEFYTRARYEQLVSENRKRFLDVPAEITPDNEIPESFRFTFQQKINEDLYIYRMDFVLFDSKDSELPNVHSRLINLSKAEILDGMENPRRLLEEQIEIFRILQKEGIISCMPFKSFLSI